LSAAGHVPAGAAGNCRPEARLRQRLQDLWDDMLGRDEVDVVAAAVLQAEHHRGQPPRGHRLAAYLPGDVEVLAEHAPQVAAGEEDRARAVVSAQAILLAEMREMRGDHGLPADRAQAALIGEPSTLHIRGQTPHRSGPSSRSAVAARAAICSAPRPR